MSIVGLPGATGSWRSRFIHGTTGRIERATGLFWVVEPIPESGRLSGGGIRNRLFVGPAGHSPEEPTSDESITIRGVADE
jgi:hypothetical protein